MPPTNQEGSILHSSSTEAYFFRSLERNAPSFLHALLFSPQLSSNAFFKGRQKPRSLSKPGITKPSYASSTHLFTRFRYAMRFDSKGSTWFENSYRKSFIFMQNHHHHTIKNFPVPTYRNKISLHANKKFYLNVQKAETLHYFSNGAWVLSPIYKKRSNHYMPWGWS